MLTTSSLAATTLPATAVTPLGLLATRSTPLRRLTPARPGAVGRGFDAPADVHRSDAGVTIELDLPGLDADDVDITVDGEWITIRGARRSVADDGRTTLVAERPTGSFQRRFRIGGAVDADAVRAVMDRGVLTVHLPSGDRDRARKVTIERGGAPAGALTEEAVALAVAEPDQDAA